MVPFKILMLGDVVGQPGLRALTLRLKKLVRDELKADFVVVNAENAADGFGILPETAASLFDLGVHVITSGNHIWQKNVINPMLDSDKRLLRPENYPKGVLGHGYGIYEARDQKVAVINLMGRYDMGYFDCPFRCAERLINKLKKECNIIVIDFHAEDPKEKEALGFFLDGEVSLVCGTHTHVQTADEGIMPQGTGYISDLGMTGPLVSVIGMDPQQAMAKVKSQMPAKMKVADGPAMISGIFAEIDPQSGKCLSITRIQEKSSL